MDRNTKVLRAADRKRLEEDRERRRVQKRDSRRRLVEKRRADGTMTPLLRGNFWTCVAHMLHCYQELHMANCMHYAAWSQSGNISASAGGIADSTAAEHSRETP